MAKDFCVSIFLTLSSIASCAIVPGLTQAAEQPAPEVSPSPKQQALFKKLQVDEAWKVTKGDPKVVVGVIDGGFDFFHPALKGQLEPGYYYSGGYHPETFTNLGHGTEVVSLIVARRQGADSMCGLAPGCRALTAAYGTRENPVSRLQAEFFSQHPDATMQDFQKELAKHKDTLSQWAKEWSVYQVAGAAEAIRYLVDHGSRVINISGALGSRSGLNQSKEAWAKLEDAFAYASGKNTVIVLGAGNDATALDDYPGDARSVIVVGATLLNDQRWEEQRELRGTKIKVGSTFGKRLTCMAPAENLLVCSPHEKRMYAWESGPSGAMTVPFNGTYDLRPKGATSCAAPIVSALAALILSARPDLDAKAVVRLIEQGCDDIAEPGYDIYTGHGRVNYAKTLRLALREGKN